MIRKGLQSDIPYLLETGYRLHAKSGNADVPVHKPTVVAMFSLFIRDPSKALILSERDEIIRGFIMAAAEPFWWADPIRGRRYVTDWAFYSEHRGDGLLMLEAVKNWAWTVPRVVEVACATNVPKGRGVVDGLFTSAGFERMGGMFRVSKPMEGT
jgi:hypothetical protein